MPPKRKSKKRARPTKPTIPPEDLIEEVQRKEILKAFQRSLEEEKDTLSIKESKKALKGLGVDIKSEEIRSLSDEEEFELDESAFLHFAALKLIQLNKSNKAFDLIDTGGKGVVLVEDLARVARELEEDLTEGELIEMMEFVDRSGDGMLNRKDFARIARKVNL